MVKSPYKLQRTKGLSFFIFFFYLCLLEFFKKILRQAQKYFTITPYPHFLVSGDILYMP